MKTNRLELRKVTMEDAPFIQKLVNTPGWLEYIGDRNVHDIKSAQSFISTWAIARYRARGYGPYLVLHKNKPIGICGLFKRDHLDAPDLGFAFLPEYIGKGFAKESSNAVMIMARELSIKKLYAITDQKNDNSQGLLIALGFSQDTDKCEKNSLLFSLSLRDE